MSKMLIKSYPNYNGCRPGVCIWQCETPKRWEVKERKRIARRREKREWQKYEHLAEHSEPFNPWEGGGLDPDWVNSYRGVYGAWHSQTPEERRVMDRSLRVK